MQTMITQDTITYIKNIIDIISRFRERPPPPRVEYEFMRELQIVID
jgi:hypothetical protein